MSYVSRQKARDEARKQAATDFGQPKEKALGRTSRTRSLFRSKPVSPSSRRLLPSLKIVKRQIDQASAHGKGMSPPSVSW
jgi:C4-dicarboxylate-specific signal transduction histidine kinase